MSELITAEWLASVGFKWHQMDRQPDKHWLLWLGPAVGDCIESLGVELAPCLSEGAGWFCWLRADTSGRYSRFIHLRYVHTQADVQSLVAALSGTPWAPENHLWGAVRTPEQVAQLRAADARLDRRLLLNRPAWAECEKDPTRGGALPDHLEEHVQRRGPRP